jgi:hypothetical protein
MQLTREVFGLCIHGLLGDIFSRSMNGLAARLNAETPSGCHFYVVGGNDPDFERDKVEAMLDEAVARNAIVVPIGHSLGADMVCRQCRRLNGKSVPVPLAVAVDPVDWDSNANALIQGRWEIDANVAHLLNPRQLQYPGGGEVFRAAGNTTTVIDVMLMPQYPHASLFGFDIGSCPETQHAVTTAVQTLCAGLAKK